MLFDINKDGDIFTKDPRLAVIQEFIDLYKAPGFGSKYIKWVALVYDYESPYRNKPIAERIRILSKEIFGVEKEKSLQKEVVLVAIDKYNELQYDPLIDLDQIYREKIAELNMFLLTTKISVDNFESMMKAMKEQKGLVEAASDIRKTVRDIMKDKTSNNKIRGDAKSAFITENLKDIKKRMKDAV